jgi:hypothetical protein
MSPKDTALVSARTEKNVLSISDWIKIASFETAGSGNWIAPDLFGDGLPYVIGVVVLGAGGSGAIRMVSSNSSIQAASGGASGFSRSFTMTVTPGQSYPYVVGAKGASVVKTSLSGNGGNGLAGGSSSFNGKAANGGEGGYANANSTSGAIGGQNSQGTDYNNSITPFGGVILPVYGGYGKPFGTPIDCFNPFESKKMLGAGGMGLLNGNIDGSTNGGKDPITGLGGGNGMSSTSGAGNGNSATASGCGGGGISIMNYSSGTVSSGAGADGAVYIYARKAVS